MGEIEGFYWANISGEWEVVWLHGDEFSRAGSDVLVRFVGGYWVEMGEHLDVRAMIGPMSPPDLVPTPQEVPDGGR